MKLRNCKISRTNEFTFKGDLRILVIRLEKNRLSWGFFSKETTIHFGMIHSCVKSIYNFFLSNEINESCGNCEQPWVKHVFKMADVIPIHLFV